MIPFTAESIGIPTLDPAWQATAADLPSLGGWWLWKEGPRPAVPFGVHFYTWDYKFTAIRKNPLCVPASGAAVAVEPNYSTYPGQPTTEVLHDIWRKRTFASRWAAVGMKLLVDLNIWDEFEAHNFLGVPSGWAAYASRSHRKTGVAGVLRDFDAAVRHAGTDDILFAVFGGGVRVKALCAERGWPRIPNRGDLVRGRS